MIAFHSLSPSCMDSWLVLVALPWLLCLDAPSWKVRPPWWPGESFAVSSFYLDWLVVIGVGEVFAVL